jgi:hypothetical protein
MMEAKTWKIFENLLIYLNDVFSKILKLTKIPTRPKIKKGWFVAIY